MNEPARTSEQKKLLEKYVAAVMRAPGSLQLTAAKSEVEFWERHILDALSLLELLPDEHYQQNFKAIDIGSGNGIPGIPAAIALPQWQLFLLDSNNKKSGFLDMFCNSNRIGNIHILPGRAEALAHQLAFRAQFDIAFARALSKLPTALELSIPFLKVGGILIIPHGNAYQSALTKSENALHELRTSLMKTQPYKVGNSLSFTALFFRKDQETPERYPRKEGVPKKRPL